MNRHLGLDVLRGVAVLLVLVAHLPAGPASVVVQACQMTGWIGVDLFFVLSGFLVSGLLFREHQRNGRLDVGRFLIRRGLKIYPAYYAFLAVTLVGFVVANAELGWVSAGSHVVYLQNYLFLVSTKPPDLWGHTWTLAVEEHFYLLLAGTFWLLARRRSANPFPAVPWICLGTSAVCLGLRAASMQWLPHSYATHYSPTHLRLDSLTTGVAFSYLLHYHRDATTRLVRSWTLPLASVGLAMFLGLPLTVELHSTRWMWTYGFSLVALGGVLLVAVVVVRDWSSIALLRPVAFVGRCSYSVYLWHGVALLPVGLYHFVVLRTGVPPGMPAYVGVCIAYVGTAIALGVAATRLVEDPVLRLRDRVWPSFATSQPPTPFQPRTDDTPDGPAPLPSRPKSTPVETAP